MRHASHMGWILQMTEEKDIKRARLSMQQELRGINREVIHGLVPELDLAKLKPFFNLVANARGLYIKRLLEIAGNGKTMPTDAQVKELSLLRRSYDELLNGGHIIETAIDRGYIDVD